MVQPPVVFEQVSKRFRRGERHDSLRDLIPSLVRRLGSSPPPPDHLAANEFWAVRDVSFEVHAGEALGIIGSNGAGKSTTLKLLTKILRPTIGRCEVRGRVGALIEVSAGFHPDLTGRENVYLQGAVMGMKRAEIASKFETIVEFSGLEDFIDTPIKRYSSGMNARLGFSIAAHLDPEVLIIDEVLAVGDSAFQQRCFQRIRDMRSNGVTLIFVSHNLPAIEMLCDRTLLLSRGTGAFLGDPVEATRRYLAPAEVAGSSGSIAPVDRTGDRSIEISEVRFLSENGVPLQRITSGVPVQVEVDLWAHQSREMVVGVQLRDAHRQIVFGEHCGITLRPFTLQPGERATCKVFVQSLAVAEGRYTITVSVHSPVNEEMYDCLEGVCRFEVDVQRDITRFGFVGLSTGWTLTRHQLEGERLLV